MARRAAGALFVLVVSVAAPAYAADQEACLASYASAQRLSRTGHLQDARKELLVCGAEDCSPVLRRDCGDWLADVSARMPSILVAATEEGRVLVDGKEVADPRALVEVDPGPHVVHFERARGAPLEVNVVVQEREKGRLVELGPSPRSLPTPLTPPPPPEPPRARPLPWTFWTAAGVTGVAATSFAVFALQGRGHQADLDACRGHCPQGDVDAVRDKYLVADVSLGVALVAAVVAAVIVIGH